MSRPASPSPSTNSHHIPINSVQQPLLDQHQPHSTLHVPSGIPHNLPPPPTQPPTTFMMASGNGSTRVGRKAFSTAVAVNAEDTKYQAKYKELKRKVRDIEADNDKLQFKVMQARRNIQRAKLARAIFYERLGALPPTPPSQLVDLAGNPIPLPGHPDVHGAPPAPEVVPPQQHHHRHRDSHRERDRQERRQHQQQQPDPAQLYPPLPGSHQQHESPPTHNVVQVETDQGPALVLADEHGNPIINENGHVIPASSIPGAVLPPPPSAAPSHSRRRERRDRERERDREERYERDREVHGHQSRLSQHDVGPPSHLEPPPLSEDSRSRSRSAADAQASYQPPLSPPLPAEHVHQDAPPPMQAPAMHGSHSHRERPTRAQRDRDRQRDWERERELRERELREHETHLPPGHGYGGFPDVLPAGPGAPPAQAQIQERDREVRERERGRERADRERDRDRPSRRHELQDIAPAQAPPASAEMAHAHITPHTSPEAVHREPRTSAGRPGQSSSYNHSHGHSRSHSTSPTSPAAPSSRYPIGRVHAHQRMGPGTNFNREFDLEQFRERMLDSTPSAVPDNFYARQGESSSRMAVDERDVDTSGGHLHMEMARDRDYSDNERMDAVGTRSVSPLSGET